MSEIPRAYLVKVVHELCPHDSIDWGPFLDYSHAERCMVALAANPKVLQAKVEMALTHTGKFDPCELMAATKSTSPV